jgi:hypothetical protein
MNVVGRLGAAEGFKTRVPLVGRKTPSAAPSLWEDCEVAAVWRCADYE